MKMIYKPDFKLATNTADIFLLSAGITQFPFSLKKLLKRITLYSISLCSYSKAKQKYGIDPSKLGSNDGETIKRGDKYIIFYNDNQLKTRQRWTIAHEIGHIVMKHSFENIDEQLYSKMEVEANFFAAQLLIPNQIINIAIERGYNITVDFIIQNFNVSEEAAIKKLETLNKNYEYNYKKDDDSLNILFSGFVDMIAPNKFAEIDYFDEEYDMQCRRDEWW